ncbi:MAG: CpsD/CapB family tyrosine-protein kinase [Chloroflexi bacterium]|nr:CpsD/CapB family tyrosine-protein kinase [Chloroflexota bacterium]
MFRNLRDVVDVVIFDSSHIVGVTDALVLARQADSVLLLLRSGRESATQAKMAQRRIEEVGGRLIGVALNSVQFNKGTYGRVGGENFMYRAGEWLRRMRRRFLR